MEKYEELIAILGDDVILAGVNENGEDVILEKVFGSEAVQVTTIQKNGRLRKNVYHIDGTTEELYER